nr:MAG TPA: hypothetical protein [Caudoviricetes sp.]
MKKSSLFPYIFTAKKYVKKKSHIPTFPTRAKKVLEYQRFFVCDF